MLTRNIPLSWHVPEGLRAEYATNVVVQKGEREMFLLFFQAEPPVIAGETEDREEQLKKVESIRARCVSKVILAPERLPEVIRLLQSMVEPDAQRNPEENES
jgi:hypothetical protein